MYTFFINLCGVILSFHGVMKRLMIFTAITFRQNFIVLQFNPRLDADILPPPPISYTLYAFSQDFKLFLSFPSTQENYFKKLF